MLTKIHTWLVQAVDFAKRAKKALVGASGTIVLVAGALLGESSPEYVAVVGILTTLGVYAARNKS